MLDIILAEKDYEAVYYKAKGREIKGNIDIYNKTLMSNIDDIGDMKFFVCSNFDSLDLLQGDKQIQKIYGLFQGRRLLLAEEETKYIYTVDLLDDEDYHQNSQSGYLIGKVKELEKFNFNFEFSDYEKHKKRTFLDLLRMINADMTGEWAETYAITRFNMDLLSNICKYRGKSFAEYEKHVDSFLRDVEKHIKPGNIYRNELIEKLEKVNDICELSNCIRHNRQKFRDASAKLYKRSDDVKNQYPLNIAGRNIQLSLYDHLLFNSAMPFYYQYRNYKHSTQFLLEVFYSNITKTEDERIGRELLGKGEGSIEQTSISTELYGLYFPLLMNFRHSIELAYKLIFVNENIKKLELTDDEFKEHIKKIDRHDLIELLYLIEDYIENSEFEYLRKVTSFVYCNEGEDASFSRYLINREFDLYDLKTIYIYYVDINNHIKEFYPVMDDIISRMDMGFNIDNIFK